MSVPLLNRWRLAWAKYNCDPFPRLVRLFIARIFFGTGDVDEAGFDFSIGLVLSLLALPGGFVSILLFNKYSSLLQWMRGSLNIDAVATAFPDEYFFIVLSMVVTGVVAVWRWESIFPDRRDFLNLVPLPISTRRIFVANLIAMLCFAGVLAIDVNIASAFLFPLVVGATQTEFSFFIRFAITHGLTVGLASLFSFFAVFSFLGTLMTVLPRLAFQRISPYLRALVMMLLVSLLATSFAVPRLLQNREAASMAVKSTHLLPSAWFLELCQSWRGRADPALAGMKSLAFKSVFAVILLAICVYAIGYRRYFVRIAEMTEGGTGHRALRWRWLDAWLDRFVLPTAAQRGSFRFVWKTLFRSESHRLILAAAGGMGLVVASQALLRTFETHSKRADIPVSADALSVPFLLVFCIVAGLRIAFEIPVEIRSNWIFRFLLDVEHDSCQPMVRKVILLATLPWVLLIAFPIYAIACGLSLAALHTALVVGWTVLLVQAVLVRYRKLPFTCSMPLFRQHSIVILVAALLGYFLFAVATPELESWALADPVYMLSFIPVALAAWYVSRRVHQDAIEIERPLIFEEVPTRAVEVLQLSE